MAKEGSNKKGIALETLAYWIIAIAILVLGVILYINYSKSGGGALDIIKRIFRMPGS